MNKDAINNVKKFAPEPHLLKEQSNGLFQILSSVIKILNYVSELIDKNKLDEGYIEATKNEIMKNIQNYRDIYQYDSEIDPIMKIETDRFFAEVNTLFPK